MILNKPQVKFTGKILDLSGDEGNLSIRVSVKPITYVTTSFKIDGLTPDEVAALRKKIYDLEITLMASDPDTRYDFSVVTE